MNSITQISSLKTTRPLAGKAAPNGFGDLAAIETLRSELEERYRVIRDVLLKNTPTKSFAEAGAIGALTAFH